MIRSITKHIQEQNWLGLVLDFIVVVLGIFLGLQASDWNQTRLDRQEADYHINFLFEDLTTAIDKAADEMKSSEEVLVESFTGHGKDGYWARSAGLHTAAGHSVFAEEDQVGDSQRTCRS